MGRRRVYVPVMADGLTDLSGGRELGPVPLAACAPALSTPAADLEDAEHDAWLAAASLARSGGSRRVIASVDIDDALVAEGEGSFAVQLLAPIPLRHIVSFHVDETPDGDDADLLWYDVTELADVRDLVTN